MSIKPDPEYDFVKPLPLQKKGSQGSQCGQCGMKFDYGVSYGFCCGQQNCPMGWGGAGVRVATRPTGSVSAPINPASQEPPKDG